MNWQADRSLTAKIICGEALLLHFVTGDEDATLSIGSLILPQGVQGPELAFALSSIFLSRQQGICWPATKPSGRGTGAQTSADGGKAVDR